MDGATTYGRGVRKLAPCMRRRAGGWVRGRRERRGGRGPSAPCSSSCEAVVRHDGGAYINGQTYLLSVPSSMVRTSYWRAFSGSSPCLTFLAFLSRMTGANAIWSSQRTSILTLSERTDFLSGTIGRRSALPRSRCSVPRTAIDRDSVYCKQQVRSRSTHYPPPVTLLRYPRAAYGTKDGTEKWCEGVDGHRFPSLFRPPHVPKNPTPDLASTP